MDKSRMEPNQCMWTRDFDALVPFAQALVWFCKWVLVLSSCCNFRSLGITGTDTLLFQLLFIGLVRVGVKIPQDGNRANRYEHVVMVHEHVWRTVCSVCATGARVAHPVPCNS